jgi:hypothetical protein
MIDKCKFGQRFCRVPAFHIYRFTITTIPAMNYVSSKGTARAPSRAAAIQLKQKLICRGTIAARGGETKTDNEQLTKSDSTIILCIAILHS